MNVLVFGASGATGYHVVSQALADGFSVTAFVRDPAKLQIDHERLRVVKGDVSDEEKVDDAVRGQDVVISALGASSPFRRDYTLIKGVENIVSAMVRQHVRRLIYQSFLGVSEYRDDLGFLINNIMPAILSNVIRDHELKEAIIVNSSLNWTIVRCAMLTNGDLTKKYKAGERIDSAALVPTISRTDVADFMLRELHDVTYIHKKPRIMKA
jgi:putative NADH-flavin reductase